MAQAIVNHSYPSSNHKLTFQYVGLEEPEKPLVKSFLSNPTSKTPPPRQALVVIRLNKQTHELIVDLSKRSIVSDTVYNGDGYPLLTIEDQRAASDLPLTHEPFLASIKKRGLDISEVSCTTQTIGWFGEEKSRRELRIQCFYLNGTVNMWLRPIEGISMFVDLEEMKIHKFIDREQNPLPKAEGTDYRASTITPPFGPSFNAAPPTPPGQTAIQMDGNVIR